MSLFAPVLTSLVDGFATKCDLATDILNSARAASNHVFVVGNGGSAAIASHMAADWLKNAGIAAMSFNDAPTLSAISNDIGYANVFSLPLMRFRRPGDVVVVISSSGDSQSTYDAAKVSRQLDVPLRLITLSGFSPDNRLHQLRADVAFHVASYEYGTVEVAHHAILHAITDELIRG